jgi:hypothetical protein
MQDKIHVKKNFRDSEGAVVSKPRPFFTNPAKKGNPATTPGVLFQKEYFEHIQDPYERKNDILKKDREEHHKSVVGEKPFYFGSMGGKVFSTSYQTLNDDSPSPPPARKTERKFVPSLMQELPFKPASPAKKVIKFDLHVVLCEYDSKCLS